MREQPKPTDTLETITRSFSEEQLSIIMSNLGAIQLTDGCSVSCDFCGVDAQRGIKVYFPYEHLERLATRFGSELATSRPFLYYASDPLDYDFVGHDYVAVHSLFVQACGYDPFVSTAVPVGKEELVVNLLLTPSESLLRRLRKQLDDVLIVNRDGTKVNTLQMVQLHKKSADEKVWQELTSLIDVKSNFNKLFEAKEILLEYMPRLIWKNSIISRISVSYMNNKRLERTFYRLVPNLMPENQKVLPYEIGPNGDLTKETILGILNAFGMEHSTGGDLPGLESVPVSSLTCEQLQEIKDRADKAANGNIKGHLYVIELPGKRFVICPDKPVTYQDIIKRLASHQEDLYFFGQAYGSLREVSQPYTLGAENIGDFSEEGISCFHGALITPAGVFNVQKVKPSAEYPFGQIIIPITPTDFRVIRLERVKSGTGYSKKVAYVQLH